MKPIVLYHDDEPQGRAFDRDSAEQALNVGWRKTPVRPPKGDIINELSDSKRPRARRATAPKRGKPKRDADSGRLADSAEGYSEPTG